MNYAAAMGRARSCPGACSATELSTIAQYPIDSDVERFAFIGAHAGCAFLVGNAHMCEQFLLHVLGILAFSNVSAVSTQIPAAQSKPGFHWSPHVRLDLAVPTAVGWPRTFLVP